MRLTAFLSCRVNCQLEFGINRVLLQTRVLCFPRVGWRAVCWTNFGIVEVSLIFVRRRTWGLGSAWLTLHRSRSSQPRPCKPRSSPVSRRARHSAPCSKSLQAASSRTALGPSHPPPLKRRRQRVAPHLPARHCRRWRRRGRPQYRRDRHLRRGQPPPPRTNTALTGC